MELDKAQGLANRLMNEHHLNKKWKFRFDRSKVRFGQARTTVVRGRVVHEITLSSHLTLASSEPSVRDTILHEIAHVLVGLEHGHDAKWQRKARALGCDLDYKRECGEKILDLAPFKYYCEDNGELVFYSHRPRSIERMWCREHDCSIERRHVDGAEVLISVI